MNRQYIGARYVPKFSNPLEWASGKSYEALTIVSYLNNSYTSKIPVPANIGNPAENPTYWALTGNYNSQIEEYRNDVSNLSSQFVDLKESYPHADSLKNRYFVFLGDSYYIGGPGTSFTGQGWCDKLINYIGLDESQYTRASIEDMTIRGGVSVPAFYPTTANHLSFYTILTNIVKHMSAEEISKTTDVVVCGGYNELSGNSTELTGQGVLDYLNYCKQVFPMARYWISFVGWTSATDAKKSQLINYKNIYQVCTAYGGIFLDGFNSLPYNSYFIADTIHPTGTGYENISIKIANQLINGVANEWLITPPINITITLTDEDAFFDSDKSIKTKNIPVTFKAGKYKLDMTNILIYLKAYTSNNTRTINATYSELTIANNYNTGVMGEIVGVGLGVCNIQFNYNNTMQLNYTADINTSPTFNIVALNNHIEIPMY